MDLWHSRNIRWLVLVLGVVLLFCSLAALVYSFGPLETLREQVPLSPTLFAPP